MKPPRTLFSLGRPGAARRDADAGSEQEPDEAVEEYEEVEWDGEEGELQFACGACSAILPTGAAFCGECGTPIDTSVWDELEEGAGEPAEAVTGEADHPDDGNAAAAAAGGAVAGAAVAGATVELAGADLLDTNNTVNLSSAAMADMVAEARAGATQELPVVEAAPLPEGADAAGADAEAAAEPAAAGAGAEPAAVLYADPSMAEPLAPAPAQPWGVSDPSMGQLDADADADADAEADDGRHTLPPSSVAGDTVAIGAGALGAGALVGDAAGAATLDGEALDGETPGTATDVAAGAPTEVVPAVEPAPPVEPPAVPAALVGTTAASMPYGTGPVQTSQKSKVPMFAGIGAGVVVLIVLAVVLLGGGSKDSPSSNVATGTSSTTAAAQSTTTKAPATSTTAGTSSTSSTTATTAPTTEPTGPASTDTTAAPPSSDTTAATTPTTAGPTVTLPTTTRPIIITTTTRGTPNLSISPTDVKIPKRGSVRIFVTNSGSGAGTYLCSSTGGSGISVVPSTGSVDPGKTSEVTIADNNGNDRDVSVKCTLPNGTTTIAVKVL